MLSNEVDAFKASLIKSGEASASHPETQVTIANAERANRVLKEQNEALENQVLLHVYTYHMPVEWNDVMYSLPL